MKKAWIPIILFISALIVIRIDTLRDRPEDHVPEGCVFCHSKMTDPDPSHPVAAFACAVCHLGNAHSVDKERAHAGMARNPGDLRVADRTCGRAGCHPDLVTRVKNSIMATNKGILRVIQKQWLGMEAVSVEVKDLMAENPPHNAAIDHYRKMCGGCHLWKERERGLGEVERRGGGCSDCHIVDKARKPGVPGEAEAHPEITTRIPSENCVKCHNRSARIGLSYFGKFESAGYGTPHEGGGLSGRRLSGNRFYMQLPADVHFSKAGMTCIDCHTATGLMGDGKAYDRMRDQVDITCEACHDPVFTDESASDDVARRLVSLNRQVPPVSGESLARTARGTVLYNLRAGQGGLRLYRKTDGGVVDMNLPDRIKAHHRLPGHERLSCQACHSAWIPQCYGCHIAYRPNETQHDWITGEDRPGRWRETRSYIRFSEPALGVAASGRISPVAPCQVFVSFFDDRGHYLPERSIRTLTMSAFDPHTTGAASRTCLDCHANPKTIGLGEGILNRKGGRTIFRPTFDSAASGLDIPFPLDAYATLGGDPLQTDSQEGVRPFNKEEIGRTLGVGPCLGCHDTYDDPIYGDFSGSVERFKSDPRLPCRKQAP